MSAYKLALIAAIVAVVEARFGQEQIPVAAVQALDGQFGNSGQASTLAGGVPGSLLGATNPCDKLRLADEIVATLGNDPAVISAAAGLVAAEQNFNPFATTIPNICGDASLPATEALRGITPLVDPAVADAATANQLSASSLNTPFDATGLSVAEIMIAQGFANIAVDGTPNAGANTGGGDAAAGGNAGGNAGNNNDAGGNAGNNNNAGGNADAGNNAGNGADAGNNAGGAADCDGAADDAANDNAGDGNAGNGNAGNNNQNNNNNGGNAGNNNAGNGADAGNNAGGNAGNAGGNAGAGGADFGLCDPRMDFQFGRNGRAATEGTFAPVDAQIGGQEALNPNIITERTCNQLTNVCEANDAAKALCQTARAEVQAAGSRGPEIADLFNSALGL